MCYSFHQKVVVANNSKAIACELSCHRWHCRDCGKVKQKAWLERFKNLAELACHFEITVRHTKRERNSFTRKLRRNFCHYIVVRIDNRYEIFHTPIYGNRQYKPNRSLWMTPKKMLEQARMILDMAVSSKHDVRITASRLIPKPLLLRNSQAGTWVTVAKTPLSIEEMNRRIKRAGFSQIELGEVFPVHRLEAVIGEDFELTSVGFQQLKEVFAFSGLRTSEVGEDCSYGNTPTPIGINLVG